MMGAIEAKKRTCEVVEQPQMWLSEKYQIHRNFRVVERMKKNQIKENQPGVIKVEDGYVYSEMFVHLTSISDRGDYWYIGFRPIGKSLGRCGFGYIRLYKNGIPECGTILIEDITHTVDIRTGEAK